mmetsp:Transcript_16736/g.56544  ORF Transcript_16736/g.56544 Transcript_16736/m.56544 type:complete len:203 (-) Transcript_16736:56-664(-)
MLDSHGRTVSGVPLLLTVRRCGLNFKFVGHAVGGDCDTFVGYAHQDAVLRLLETQPHSRHDAVRSWQHSRVLELLLASLALVKPLRAPTAELASLEAGGLALVVSEGGSGADVFGPCVQDTALGRGLADTQCVLRKHNAKVAADRAKAAALGLAAPEPSPHALALAAGKFKLRLAASAGGPVVKKRKGKKAEALAAKAALRQ